MAAGKLTPLIDRIMPLEESAAAHEYMEKGHARGKVVLQVMCLEQSGLSGFFRVSGVYACVCDVLLGVGVCG